MSVLPHTNASEPLRPGLPNVRQTTESGLPSDAR